MKTNIQFLSPILLFQILDILFLIHFLNRLLSFLYCYITKSGKPYWGQFFRLSLTTIHVNAVYPHYFNKNPTDPRFVTERTGMNTIYITLKIALYFKIKWFPAIS